MPTENKCIFCLIFTWTKPIWMKCQVFFYAIKREMLTISSHNVKFGQLHGSQFSYNDSFAMMWNFCYDDMLAFFFLSLYFLQIPIFKV